MRFGGRKSRVRARPRLRPRSHAASTERTCTSARLRGRPRVRGLRRVLARPLPEHDVHGGTMAHSSVPARFLACPPTSGDANGLSLSIRVYYFGSRSSENPGPTSLHGGEMATAQATDRKNGERTTDPKVSDSKMSDPK